NFLRANNYLVNHNLVDNEKSKEIIKTPEYVEEPCKGNAQFEEQKIFSNEQLLVDQPEEEVQLNPVEKLELSEQPAEKKEISTEDVSIHYETKNDDLSALGEVDNDSKFEQSQKISSSISPDTKLESPDFECKNSSVEEKDICENTAEIISVQNLSYENNEPENEDVDEVEEQSATAINLCIGELNTREKDFQDENYLQNIENNEKSTVEKLVVEVEKKLINLEPEELNSVKVDYDLEIKLETVKYEEKIAEDCNLETLNIKKEVSDLTGEEERGISESPIEEETIPTIESITEVPITNEKVIDEEIMGGKVTDETIINEKVTDDSFTKESINNEKVIVEKVIDEETIIDEDKITTRDNDYNKIEVNENEPVDEIEDRVIKKKKKYFINDEQPFIKPVISTDENTFLTAQIDATEAIMVHKEKRCIFGQICDFFTSGMCCSTSEEKTVEVNPAVYTLIDYLESNYYNYSNLFTTSCTDENYKEIVRTLTNGNNVEFWNYTPYEIVAGLKMYIGKELNGLINTEYSEIILKVLLNKGKEGELIIKQNGKLVMVQDRLELLIKILNLFKKMNNLNRNKIYYDELVASIAPYLFPLNLCNDVSNEDILRATTLVCNTYDLTKIRIMLGIN
ncbi:hypothetical protein DMUE_1985, partial [Dictyocoela muelleri]